MTRVVNIAQSGGNNVTMRNKIINGAMMIDQRNAGASISISGSNSAYSIDRWNGFQSTDGAFTLQQVSDAPAGFINSLKFTTTTADSSLGATQWAAIRQNIEGLNTFDFSFGTASATSVTVSFWVKSSLTGTFGGAILNSAENRSYPFTYAISSANTWEQKSVTITGDTSGTWLTTNGVGMRLVFGLGVGSTYSGTANAWTSSSYIYSATGATSVIGTLNATWQITGVQLEAGTTATPFEQRLYGTELALCQRYYEKSYNLDVVPGTASNARGLFDISTASEGNSYTYSLIKYSVPKRDNPTMTGYTYNAGTSGSWTYARSGATGNASVSFGSIGVNTCTVSLAIGAAWVACEIYGHWTASSEL